jgi:plastocyanin
MALLSLLAALALPSALAQAQNPQLVATVGTNDALVITLRDASGNAVTQLDPGTYNIAVSDRSAEHNFHLSGPNVNQATAIELKEEVTWTVTFTDGRYTFVCDAHPTDMRGGFTVGNVPPPPVRARLSGSVGPGKRISVRPKTVTAGPVRLTVTDRSRVDNFHLTGPGVNRKTGVAFRGRVSWNLTLRAGRYTYRSDKTKRLRGTLTVTPSA